MRLIESAMRTAAAVHDRVAATSTVSVAVRSSILKSALAGELVPTEAALARLEGRDYESGEQLLARIAREREAIITSADVANARGARTRLADRTGTRTSKRASSNSVRTESQSKDTDRSRAMSGPKNRSASY